MPPERPSLLILGTGFAAFSLLKDVDVERYQVTIVAPRNHFLFTPLLPSTTVGTVEFRSIMEPIRVARKGIRFHQGYCEEIDVENKIAHCKGKFKSTPFEVKYDKLVIAVGAANNTFGIPGVEEHAHFLKETSDARKIRQEIIQCFERASKPGRPTRDFEWLLHFVVVGGGPTGVEFAAELHDFLNDDLSKWFPDLMPYVNITLVEAQDKILTAFDASLQDYTRKRFSRQRIRLRTNAAVREVAHHKLILADGDEISYGLLVWSTGNTATDFVQKLPFEKIRGRLVVDEQLRVPGADGVFSAGDCSVTPAEPLPQTAQAAQQEGKYLAKLLNDEVRGIEYTEFHYKHMGMMVYVGDKKALADMKNIKGKGFATWIFWRSAYFTKLMSWKNKTLVFFDWVRTWVFGRDISQF